MAIRATRISFITGDYSAQLYARPLAQAFVDRGHVVSLWGDRQDLNPKIQWLGSGSAGIMGFSDLLPNAWSILSSFRRCKKLVTQFNPDIIIFVDYAGFNLQLLRWARHKGYKVVYYIPPKVWASRQGRLSTLQKYCHQLICIYPFEQSFLMNKGLNASYFGNAYATQLIDSTLTSNSRTSNLIAFLPGSRLQEINYLLPLLKPLARAYPQHIWAISQAPHIPLEVYSRHLDADVPSNVQFQLGHATELLAKASLALVCSGTATMEAAVLSCPQIVMYRSSKINYEIAKRMITTNYISLPNLLLTKEAVPELIQENCNLPQLQQAIDYILRSEGAARMEEDYRRVKEMLYAPSAADDIGEFILANE